MTAHLTRLTSLWPPFSILVSAGGGGGAGSVFFCDTGGVYQAGMIFG